MSSELTLEQAALAWAQGKRVEARPAKGGCWKPIDNIGECDAEKFSQSVFGFRDDFEFRLAPEPPAKKFRPWTPEEVPVGAVMRWKIPQTHASLICSPRRLMRVSCWSNARNSV